MGFLFVLLLDLEHVALVLLDPCLVLTHRLLVLGDTALVLL